MAISELLLHVQPSLATLLMKPPSAAKSIFQDNGQTRRLRSYFPDPTEDINNKVCALPRCLSQAPYPSQVLIVTSRLQVHLSHWTLEAHPAGHCSRP